jgi:hypothetical protein
MDQLLIDGEVFEKKVEKVEKVLSTENEVLFQKSRKEKIEGICTHLLSIPFCEICDFCLKRRKF